MSKATILAKIRAKQKHIIYVQDLTCPKCGAEEMHPNGEMLLIRAFKVEQKGKWWSQCLVCSGGYDKNLNFTQGNSKPNKGWF